MKVVITKDIARACGQDAGNRNMRKHGRTAWDEDDYNAASTEFNRLMDFFCIGEEDSHG